MESCVICTIHQTYYSDQTEEDWMDGECGTHGEKINAYGFFFREHDDFEDLVNDGKRIIFQMVLREIGWQGVGWIYLNQERDKW